MENLVVYEHFFDIPRAECRRRAGELLEFVQSTSARDTRSSRCRRGIDARVSISPLADQRA